MTQSTKDKLLTGIVVGMAMLFIQFLFTGFQGRWASGSPYVKKDVFSKEKEEIINKAYNYTDSKVKVIDDKVELIKTNQEQQFEDIKSDLTTIKNALIKDKK